MNRKRPSPGSETQPRRTQGALRRIPWLALGIMLPSYDPPSLVAIARADELDSPLAGTAYLKGRASPGARSPADEHSDGTHRAPCPQEMALVGSVCMDRYEASLVLADAPAHAHSPFEAPVPGQRYLAKSQQGEVPQAYISRDEAAAACRLAQKRLCTGVEWQRACRGATDADHPYGAKEVRGRCNTGKPHLPSVLFGMNSTAENAESHYNSPRLNQQPGYLARTGEYAGCVSDSGIFDLEGNLHEWVADQPEGTPRVGPRSRAVFMGGFYSSTNDHGPGCQHVSRRHSPAYHDYSTGFRCCRDK